MTIAMRDSRWLSSDASKRSRIFCLLYEYVERDCLKKRDFYRIMNRLSKFNSDHKVKFLSHRIDEHSDSVIVVLIFQNRISLRSSSLLCVNGYIPIVWNRKVTENLSINWMKDMLREVKNELAGTDNSTSNDKLKVSVNYGKLNLEIELDKQESVQSKEKPTESKNKKSEDSIELSQEEDHKTVTNSSRSVSRSASSDRGVSATNIIDVVRRPFPSISVNRKSPKSESNRNITISNNYDTTPAMLRCFNSNKHKIIIGGKDMGKTAWAKYILDHKCVVVEKFDDLKNFNHEEHQGIIFENIDFSNVHDMIKHFIVFYEDRIIRFENKDVFLAGSTELIFTTRKDDGMIFGKYQHNRKLYNSCHAIRLTSKTYIVEHASGAIDDGSDSDELFVIDE